MVENKVLTKNDIILLTILIENHLSKGEFDSFHLNEYGEVEVIKGSTWKWVAKLLGHVQRIPFWEVCQDIANNLVKDDVEIANQIALAMKVYMADSQKSELISKLFITYLYKQIGVGMELRHTTIHEEVTVARPAYNIPVGLWLVDVSEHIYQVGDKPATLGEKYFNHPNVQEIIGSRVRR